MQKFRAHIFVSGKVQGVFFRAFTRDVARAMGVNGWVKNLPDGRVEAVLEGKKEDIENALREIKKGPPHAIVENIDISWNENVEDFTDFNIRY